MNRIQMMLGCMLVALLPAASPLTVSADSSRRPDAVTPDGGRYHGALKDGLFHGKGLLEWANGERYEGEFSRGRFHGRGKLKLASGDTYEGEFRDGLMSGQGRMTHVDGSVYEGQFTGDYFNGRGRFESPDGERYEGELKNGRFQGEGHYVEDDLEYRGQFRHGRFWGEGSLRQGDGGQYRGAFERSRFHGMGRFENAAGEVYEGRFDKGVFTGEGVFTRPDGSRYQGEFLNWLPHGRGKFTDGQGNVYEGRFSGGQLEGDGRFAGHDGSLYEGGFSAWQFHGQGRYRQANGDIYTGGFEYGLFHGQGRMTYAAARPGGRTADSGTWQYGQFSDPSALRKAARDAETALYSQRRLLDEALSRVAPGDPGRIDLFLLSVAGDGSQEVFRREVEFVREQFAQRFGSGQRTVALINSRATAGSAPLATVTSIRESLKAIAARMDRDNDVLFLFLTSHGSEAHELSLSPLSVGVPGLAANELGTLLRESGIRWKVVVVSACYGGGFIEPLDDGHTLIITAARHDRRSFGCADENDFTYFGEAYFRDALPRSRSFQEAFQLAERRVRERELAGRGAEAEEASFSLPQMRNPAAIERHLKRWWAQAERRSAQVR